MNETQSLLEFPCRFAIKVMGRDRADFEPHVIELISTHVGEIAAKDVVARSSSKGTYLALTVTIQAISREQLDEVYRSLTASELILWVI